MGKPAICIVAAALVAATAGVARAGCNEAELSKLDHSLGAIRELHAELVAGGLGQACTLPPALAAAFKKLLMGGRDLALSAGLSVVEADPMLWARACAGGSRAVVEAGRGLDDPRVGPRQQAQALWAGCGLEHRGVATADEWSRAGKTAVLAIAAAEWMHEAKLAPDRVRSYTRALAGLDEPAPKSLAARYPDDGLAGAASPPPPPPPRRGAYVFHPRPGARNADVLAGGPPPPAPTLEAELVWYLGRSDLAERYTEVVRQGRRALAACWATPYAAPLPLTLKLVVADGAPQDGELVRVERRDGATHEDHLFADPRFERCLLARAARLKFPPFAAPTTVEVELRRGPAGAGEGGSVGLGTVGRGGAADGVEGGVEGGVVGGSAGGVEGGVLGGARVVSGQIFQKRSTLGERASRRLDAEVQASDAFGACLRQLPDGKLHTTATITVQGHAVTAVQLDPPPDARTAKCLVDAWRGFELKRPATGTLVYTFRFGDPW